jgi:hypothetical protein
VSTDQHRDELSKFVGDEISKTLSEQRRLEARYQELIAQRAALKVGKRGAFDHKYNK